MSPRDILDFGPPIAVIVIGLVSIAALRWKHRH